MTEGKQHPVDSRRGCGSTIAVNHPAQTIEVRSINKIDLEPESPVNDRREFEMNDPCVDLRTVCVNAQFVVFLVPKRLISKLPFLPVIEEIPSLPSLQRCLHDRNVNFGPRPLFCVTEDRIARSVTK